MAKVSLKKYVDALRKADHRFADDRFRSQLREIKSALKSLDKRISTLNELREVVTQIIATLVTRQEFEQTRRYDVENGRAGATGLRGNISTIGVVVAVAVSLYTLFTR